MLSIKCVKKLKLAVQFSTTYNKSHMFSKNEKILIFVLCFIQFSHIVDFMIVMPLGPQLMRSLQISPHEFGLLVSAYTFSAGVFGLLSAFFIDRFDRKSCLLFFYTGFTVGTIGCALAQSYPALLLTRSVAGAFGGVLGSLCMAIISDAIESSRRGTAIGWLTTAFSMASIFGVPFSLYLATHYSWNAPFIFLGVICLLLFAVIAKGVPPMRAHLDGSKESPWQVLSHVLYDKNQLYALAFYAFLILGHFIVIPFFSPSLVANAGLTEAQLPLIYLVGGGFSIITSPLIGKMTDRFGKEIVFKSFVVLSAIPLLIVTHLGITPLPLILALTVLFFTCMGGRMIPAQAIMTATVDPKHRGSFMSFMNSVQQFAAAASYIAGLVVIKDPAGHLTRFEWTGYIAVGFSLCALLLVFRVKSVSAK